MGQFVSCRVVEPAQMFIKVLEKLRTLETIVTVSRSNLRFSDKYLEKHGLTRDQCETWIPDTVRDDIELNGSVWVPLLQSDKSVLWTCIGTTK